MTSNLILTITYLLLRLLYHLKTAICKNRNGESGNRMRGMREMGVGMQGIRVGLQGIWVGMRGIRVGMQGIEVGMRGIRKFIKSNSLFFLKLKKKQN